MGSEVPFWAPYAATDLLNLKQNEGLDFGETLKLFLLPDFGLRHAIYTLLKVPENATPKLEFHIGESSEDHLARSVLPLLLLLGGPESDPVLNAETAIHLWYSAKLPERLWKHFESHTKGYTNQLEQQSFAQCEFADPSFVAAARLQLGPSELNIHLVKHYWYQLMARTLRSPLTPEYATLTRVTALAKCNQPDPKTMARMGPTRAASAKRWCEDGLLLPAAHPRADFDVVNPIFFSGVHPYPSDAAREPLTEWPMEMLDFADGPDDVYGKMFFYLRDLLVRFQAQARRLKPTFHIILISTETDMDPPSSNGDIGADRVECGSQWARNPMFCIRTMRTLLKNPASNPYATGLVMCRDGVTEKLDCTKKDRDLEQKRLHVLMGTALDTLAPPVSTNGDLQAGGIQAIVRRQAGLLAWRNWDKFFDRHLKNSHKYDFSQMCKERFHGMGPFDGTFCGLEVRVRNIVTKRWPTRLVHAPKDTPSPKRFNQWLAWGDNAPERWMEWKMANNVTVKEDWAVNNLMGVMQDMITAGQEDFDEFRNENIYFVPLSSEDTSTSGGYSPKAFSPVISVMEAPSQDAAKVDTPAEEAEEAKNAKAMESASAGAFRIPGLGLLGDLLEAVQGSNKGDEVKSTEAMESAPADGFRIPGLGLLGDPLEAVKGSDKEDEAKSVEPVESAPIDGVEDPGSGIGEVGDLVEALETVLKEGGPSQGTKKKKKSNGKRKKNKGKK